MSATMKCRHCGTELTHVFCDLITSPPSNAMLKPEQLNGVEPYYPLKTFVCDNCWLVQIDEVAKATDIFDAEYTYFSSYSTSWLEHSKRYVEMMIDRFGFDENSQVIEIASNDGYLLQYFQERKVPVLGVEPTANTAAVAQEKGIETIVEFFGCNLVEGRLIPENRHADLVLGNNVLAHVPDINDFVHGIKKILKPGGVVTIEFPHLWRLVKDVEFDTIYHEHYSYLSFTTVRKIFNHFGLEMFDVEEHETAGGSLRIFAKHMDDNDPNKAKTAAVDEMMKREKDCGTETLEYYSNFQERTDKVRADFLEFLLKARAEGKKVIGYGAAAKGNTLINYCGIKGNELIEFVVDANPHKQNKYLPGSRIPVVSKEEISKFKPDYVIILPWNLRDEISEQHAYIREWGGKFVTAIPEIRIL